MSTRSTIAIKTDSGFTAIYCHFDGYLDGAGVMLKEHYNTADLAAGLVSLGDISSLGEVIGEKHPFDERGKNDAWDKMTFAYHRDRGEEWEDVKPKEFRFFTDLWNFAVNSWAQYLYMFIDGKWMYTSRLGLKWYEVDFGPIDVLKEF